MPMNQEIKSQWTAALRSGDYPQAKGHLRTAQGYCCLGVLCQMAADANVIPQPELNTANVFVYGVDRKDRDSMFLPVSVQRWSGLKDDNGILDSSNPMVTDEHGSFHHLAHMNDDDVPFGEIADLIDANL